MTVAELIAKLQALNVPDLPVWRGDSECEMIEVTPQRVFVESPLDDGLEKPEWPRVRLVIG